jgi:hypothetical protein
MSLVDFLLEKRTPLELAKELAATAKENATLKDRVFALEHEVFWLKAAERNGEENDHAK